MTESRQKAATIGVAVVMALVLLAVYSRTITAPLQFDDINVIVNETRVHSLDAWWQSMPGIRPLLKLSYTLNWINAASATGFHITNIFVHIINTLLLWHWLRLWLHHTGRGDNNNSLAFWCAMIWALHPALTESVSYVSGRSMSLMALFVLTTLLANEYAQYATRQARKAAHIIMFAATLCALAVRETAWVLPLLLALIECFRGPCSPAAIMKKTWPVWLAALFAITAILVMTDYQHLLRHSLHIRTFSEQARAAITGHFYLLTQPVLQLLPNIDPDLLIPNGGPLLVIMASLPVMMLVLAVWQRRRRPLFSLGVCWWLLNLLPVLGIFPRNDVASDRHVYLALFGLVLAVLSLLPVRRVLPMVGAVLCCVLFISTLIRNEDYRSAFALWARTTEQSPQKARPWNNLGVACDEAGDRQCALAAWQRALIIDPDFVRARINMYYLQRSALKK